jgi:putative two-component system response regulator
MAGREEDERRLQEGRLSSREMLICLAKAGRSRDEETAEHVARMSRTCELIAGELGFGQRRKANLRVASALHDIGKIGVPDSVLRKPGPLSRSERVIIERHVEIGHWILSGSSDPVTQLAATIALTHHERVDGGGYPSGLRGKRIPLVGRIAAVADVFDALTHNRVYRPAMSTEDAISMLSQGCGTHFDARVLDAFEVVLPQVMELRGHFPERSGAFVALPGG